MKKLKIMDWYVHQGHQYEFMKLDHDFYLSAVDALKPDWNQNHRPKNKSATFIDERDALLGHRFDVVMVRSPLNVKRYEAFHIRGAKGIAVVQTTTPFNIPKWVKLVVWNSKDVMDRWYKNFPNKKHFYIPHGYDHKEFIDMRIERKPDVLTVCNVFKGRASFLGYDIWRYIDKRIPNCIVYGHGNEDMKRGFRECDSLDELIRVYNSSQVYLNTTTDSAMPRSRAEAMMCGCPLVTTDNYDIGRYVKNNESAILTNDKDDLVRGIKKLLDSPSMRSEFGEASRQIARKHFGLKKYLKRWEQVFDLV